MCRKKQCRVKHCCVKEGAEMLHICLRGRHANIIQSSLSWLRPLLFCLHLRLSKMQSDRAPSDDLEYYQIVKKDFLLSLPLGYFAITNKEYTLPFIHHTLNSPQEPLSECCGKKTTQYWPYNICAWCISLTVTPSDVYKLRNGPYTEI